MLVKSKMTERRTSTAERRRRTLETITGGVGRRMSEELRLAIAEAQAEEATRRAASETVEARVAARNAARERMEASTAAATLARSQASFAREQGEARRATLLSAKEEAEARAATAAARRARRTASLEAIRGAISPELQEAINQARAEAEGRKFGVAPIMRHSMNPRVVRNPMFGNIIAPTRQFRTFLPGAVGKVRSVGEIAPVRPIKGLIGTPFYKVPKNHGERKVILKKLNAASRVSKGMRKHASKLRKSVARKKVRKVSRKRSKSVRRRRPLPAITPRR